MKDLMTLSMISSLIFVSVVTFYHYFTTYDTKYFTWGLILASLAVIVAFARYRFLIDTVGTLW